MIDIKSFFEKQVDWQDVQSVASVLSEAGFKAYLAGGCVRDALLGRTPKDFDLATDATPEQVEGLFSHTEAVGKSFGVILVKHNNTKIEVATFRRDGEYSDGRRPESVHFSSAEEDAQRRDFTVNALFYDTQENILIDFVSGQEDLHKKLLRAVGEPEKRFSEDKLRLLRAVRFSAELGFSIEANTALAMAQFAKDINMVAVERRLHEMDSLLQGSFRLQAINTLWESGLWSFSSINELTQIKQNLQKIDELRDLSILWALFLPQNFNALNGLKLPKQRRREIEHFWKTKLNLLSTDSGKNLGESLRLAGQIAPQKLCNYLNIVRVAPDFVQELCARLTQSGELIAPLVTGEDLKNRGETAGPEMGEMLKLYYERQLADPSLQKSDLLG